GFGRPAGERELRQDRRLRRGLGEDLFQRVASRADLESPDLSQCAPRPSRHLDVAVPAERRPRVRDQLLDHVRPPLTAETAAPGCAARRSGRRRSRDPVWTAVWWPGTRWMGRVAGAVAEFDRLLTAQQRVLGADHPDTLTTRNNLAFCRGEGGM